MMMLLRLVVNFVLFQSGWFACLLLHGYWPLLITVIILWVHLALIVVSEHRQSEVLFLLKTLFIGGFLEIFYLLSGALHNLDGSLLPPLWLLCIWLLFASTLRHSLSWMRSKLWLSVLFAVLAAPVSYYAGTEFSAYTELGSPVVSLLIIAASWALVFPFLLRLALPSVPRL